MRCNLSTTIYYMTDAKQFIFKIETRADKHQRRRRKTGDNREEESPERSSSDEENAGKVNRDKTSKDKRVPDEYDDDDDNPPKPKRQVHLLKLFLYKMIRLSSQNSTQCCFS